MFSPAKAEARTLPQRSAAESVGLKEAEVTQLIIAQLAICGLIHILGTERV